MVQVRQMVRCRVRITGAVQGVGFRPYIYRLATGLMLKGWVRNTSFGVEIEVEGERSSVEEFLRLLPERRPPLSSIYGMDVQMLPPVGYGDFEIVESSEETGARVAILPDIATCQECLSEMRDPEDRRYRYPFINCTNCGPRFTIIERLPYDRKNTTMRTFTMCPRCLEEYNDPGNRRFHAQPNACGECGPQIWLEDATGRVLARGDEALRACARAIRGGEVVAVKGLGGFHLMCLATSDKAVGRLREGKRRQEKPFAVMFRDVDTVEEYAYVSSEERRVLTGVERPIVLLRAKGGLSPLVSPNLKSVGAFLPYTPLHHLLLEEVGSPVVATSGNLTDEPMVIDNGEALIKLSSVASLFLMHNREIARRCDDSVCFVACGRRVMVRRARGFAPLPVPSPLPFDRPVLAVGGHLKNTVALAFDRAIYVFQHVGDLEHAEAADFFREAVEDVLSLFGVEPGVVVVDRHPGYYSRRYAIERFGDRIVEVQHHVAHVLSCACEAGLEDGFIGVALDGTGYGDDGSVWGGELFVVKGGLRRVMHLLPFRLAGGDRAVLEPYRSAVSLAMGAGVALPGRLVERVGGLRVTLVAQMLERGINTFTTTSAGRLFDGASSLAGVRDFATYEAQAAMEFEHAAVDEEVGAYPFKVSSVIDWRPAIARLVEDVEKGVPAGVISRRFHAGFAKALCDACLGLSGEFGVDRVLLSGGVFQNRLLLELLMPLLEASGLRVYVNQLVPVNDGGVSLGQAYYVAWRGRCA